MWYVVADRMPVILGNNDSVNVWLNDASVKLEEITAPYEGADLVSPCCALCYLPLHPLSPCSAGGGTRLAWFCGPRLLLIHWGTCFPAELIF